MDPVYSLNVSHDIVCTEINALVLQMAVAR